VLVIEDEEQVRVLAEAILQDEGHQTLSASDVPEALALVQSDTRIDALFTDIQLKNAEHGGLELTQKAVAARPQLRVVYTTAGGLTDGMKAMFVDGAAILPKPYLPDDLRAAVAALFR